MAEPFVEINTSHYQIERQVLSNRALNDRIFLNFSQLNGNKNGNKTSKVTKKDSTDIG